MKRTAVSLLLMGIIISGCATGKNGEPQLPPADPPVASPPPIVSEPGQTTPPVTLAQPPVTWRVTLGDGESVDGTIHLAPPYSFEIAFDGPVHLQSVEAALERNLGGSHPIAVSWTSDSSALVRLEKVDGAKLLHIDPSGGSDADGKILVSDPGNPFLTRFSFWPTEATSLQAIDLATGQAERIAHFGQPYQVVSASPTGERLLLRRYFEPLGLSVGAPGKAYTYDLRDGRLEDLEVSWLFRHQWSADGGLIVYGSCPQGQCLYWVRPGFAPSGMVEARRLLYVARDGESLWDAHLAPNGEAVAMFSGKHGETATLRILDLRPETVGRTIATVANAAGSTQGPSGLRSVPAAWNPQGTAIVYGDRRAIEDSNAPMVLWSFSTEAAAPVKLTDRAMHLSEWHPSGDKLFAGEVGVVDLTGRVLYADSAWQAAFSPDGRYLYASGKVLSTGDWSLKWQVERAAHDFGTAYWSFDSALICIGGSVASIYRVTGERVAQNIPCETPSLFSVDGRYLSLPRTGVVVDLQTMGRVEVPAFEAVSWAHQYRAIGFGPDGRLWMAPGFMH